VTEQDVPTSGKMRGVLGDLNGMTPEQYLYRYHGECLERIRVLEAELAWARAQVLHLRNLLGLLEAERGV